MSGYPKDRWGTRKLAISISERAGSFIRTSLGSIRRSRKANWSGIRVLQDAFADARGHRLHLLGLVSDGGVHSHYSHLIALANAAQAAGVTDIFVHAFTDGRDTSPTGGAGFLETCEDELKNSGARIVTVVGRYFAMDRDRRWDRTKKAWDAIVLGRGEFCESSPAAAVRATICARQDRRIHAAAHFRTSRTNSGSTTATRFCFLTFVPTARGSFRKLSC